MEYLYIGKIVNTHGIKGEVRILSDFRYKSEVFKCGINLYIGNDREMEVMKTYRVHKNFDMVTFENIDNINDVLKYKGRKIYVKETDFEFSGMLDKDIVGMEAYVNNKLIGIVTEIRKNPGNDLLVISDTILIPYIDEFVTQKDNKIIINDMEGLI